MNYDDQDITEAIGRIDLLDNKTKTMNIIKRSLAWLVVSSANSNRVALTVRAGIPLLVLWGISDTATLSNLTGEIGTVLASLGQAVAGFLTAWGILRKIWITSR